MSAPVSEPQPAPEASAAPATTSAPERRDWTPVVRVNLLPPEITEARHFRRVQKLYGVAVVASVVVAGAAVWWAQTGVTRAEDELADAQATTTRLKAQERKYAEVPQMIARVEAAQTARATVMGNDVLWYRFLADVANVAPDGVRFDSISAGVTAPSAADAKATTASDQAPLTPPGIGTVAISGTATEYKDIAAWLEAVDKVTGLDASTLSSAKLDDSSGNEGVSFTTGVTMTSAALSHRYDRKAG